MDEKLTKRIKSIFLIVYVAISIATFYHTAWGFGTIAGKMPADGISLYTWWLFGGLSAFMIDFGMGAITYAMLNGWIAKWLIFAFVVLAFLSAFSQLVFSAHHAYAYALGDVPNWLLWLSYVLDARVVVFPVTLPLFSVVYAFAAKIDPSKLPDAIVSELEERTSTLEVALHNKEQEMTMLLEENEAMKASMQSVNGTLRYVDIGRALGEETGLKAGELINIAKSLDVNPSYIMRGFNQARENTNASV